MYSLYYACVTTGLTAEVQKEEETTRGSLEAVGCAVGNDSLRNIVYNRHLMLSIRKCLEDSIFFG